MDGKNDSKIAVSEMNTYLEENVPIMAQKLKGVNQDPTVSGKPSEVLVTLK